LFTLLAILVATLAACGGAPAATAPTGASAPTNAPAAAAPTGAPSPVPVPTAAAALIAAPALTTDAATAPAATSAPLADTNPAKPDDKTQGRLRISNCVMNGPDVDLLLNGKLTVNGGVVQQNLGELSAGGYQYLAPGSYSVAIVPSGQGVDKALIGPLDVKVEAGHRYTLVMLGQADEKSHKPLLIDETEAYQKAGLSPDMMGHILINNIKGATGLSFVQDEWGERDVPYGAFAASAIPAGPFKNFKVTVSGSGEPEIDNGGAGGNVGGVDFFDCFGGSYRGAHDTHSASETSILNTLDFLQIRSEGFAKIGHPEWGFTTFLQALKTAGMTDMLTNGDPYLVFAPGNDAFAALPKAQFDALMADPKALGELLRSHLVEGYFPYGALGPVGRGVNRTVTNMRGEQLKLLSVDDGLSINGKPVGQATSTFVTNGTRVIPIGKLLLPDAK
jgi:hypothetical protein